MADRPEFNDDFVDLLRAFADCEVDFLIVGAHALAAHGVVRATGDIDIFVRPTKSNATRVVDALLVFGAPLRVHGVSGADFERAGTVYQLGLPPRRIDILTSISGVTYEVAANAAVSVRAGSVQFRVPGADALLTNKRASGRPKDLEDVRRLEAVLNDPGAE